MDISTATDLDVETMCDIFFASYNDLHRRHGLAEENPEDRDWLADAIRHVMRTDPGGTVLATDDGARGRSRPPTCGTRTGSCRSSS